MSSHRIDEELRELERSYALDSSDGEVAQRLSLLYERTDWKYKGKTISEWIDDLTEDDSISFEALDRIRELGPLAGRAAAVIEENYRSGRWERLFLAESKPIKTLAALGAASVPFLKFLINSCSNPVPAVIALGEVGEAAKPLLLEVLGKGQRWLRNQRYYAALIRMASEENLPVLFEHFKSELKVEFINLGLPRALGGLGPRAEPLLDDLVSEFRRRRDIDFRASCLVSFAKINGERTRKDIVRALRSRVEEVRSAAVAAVGNLAWELHNKAVKSGVLALQFSEDPEIGAKCHFIVAMWYDRKLQESYFLKILDIPRMSERRAIVKGVAECFPVYPDNVVRFLLIAWEASIDEGRELLLGMPRDQLFGHFHALLKERGRRIPGLVVRLLSELPSFAEGRRTLLEQAAKNRHQGIRDSALVALEAPRP